MRKAAAIVGNLETSVQIQWVPPGISGAVEGTRLAVQSRIVRFRAARPISPFSGFFRCEAYLPGFGAVPEGFDTSGLSGRRREIDFYPDVLQRIFIIPRARELGFEPRPAKNFLCWTGRLRREAGLTDQRHRQDQGSGTIQPLSLSEFMPLLNLAFVVTFRRVAILVPIPRIDRTGGNVESKLNAVRTSRSSITANEDRIAQAPILVRVTRENLLARSSSRGRTLRTGRPPLRSHSSARARPSLCKSRA